MVHHQPLCMTWLLADLCKEAAATFYLGVQIKFATRSLNKVYKLNPQQQSAFSVLRIFYISAP